MRHNAKRTCLAVPSRGTLQAMKQAAEALLSGVIDYAGLFPPAKLDMRPALREYNNFFKTGQEWIVGRFVCPANRLEELRLCLDEWTQEDDFIVSVIGSPIPETDYLKVIQSDQIAVERVLSSELVTISCYEAKPSLPSQIMAIAKAFEEIVEEAVFFEIPLNDNMGDWIEAVSDVAVVDAGVKARTGGLDASAFPSSQALAEFIFEAVGYGLPYKLTAGLHHALPFDDPGIGIRHHGFLNALFAGVMADGLDLSVVDMQRILDCRDAGEFKVTDKKIQWRDFELDLEGIGEGRFSFDSFGSCVVDEPLKELNVLGWLNGGER